MHSGEEGWDEVTLVGKVLPNTLFIVDKATLQFDDRQGNAVYIDNNIGTFVLTQQRIYVADLFGYGKIVVGIVLEIKKQYVLMIRFGVGL